MAGGLLRVKVIMYCVLVVAYTYFLFFFVFRKIHVLVVLTSNGMTYVEGHQAISTVD